MSANLVMNEEFGLIPVERGKLRRLLRVVDQLEWADHTRHWSCPVCDVPREEPHATDCALDNVRREWEGFRR